MDALEKNLAFVFVCFSISAAAFCFYSEFIQNYKSDGLVPVLLKALGGSLAMAVLGPWSYFVLVKSAIEDIKSGQATFSHLLSSTLFSFAPLVLIAAISESAEVGWLAIVVIAFSIFTIAMLLKWKDL